VNLVPTRIISTLAVLATGAALLTGSVAAQAGPTAPGPELQTIALPTVTARAESAAVAQHATRPFSLVGATWTDPRATLAGTVEVRTRRAADGTWTPWQAMASDEPNAADPGTESGPARGSTDPLWVGESTGVEARVTTTAGPRPLPAGLRLDLINPDATGAPESTGAPSARAAGRPAPKLITRAGWGANEAIVKHPPEYTTDVQVMFVHHTATTNNYACAQSASIIRGIELYHVRSRGWNDIGYNFLVDKCGTLFEGRKGGVDKPVLGAHTLGFNSHSSAIAVIGNYAGSGVPARVRTVIAQVAAYKVGAYGNNPNGRVVLTSSGSDRYAAGTRVTLNRVSGHRDTGRTECPGNALYAQLGAIRSTAGAAPAGLGYLRITGARRAGAKYFTTGLVRPLWRLTTPSALINRFDVLVDGAPAASVPNTNRTTLLRLPAGRHTLAVRALHLSGRTSTTTATVFTDTTAPVFSAGPTARVWTGPVRSSVPIRLDWIANDTTALRTVALTAPATVDLGTGTTARTGAAPGVATTWTLRATDWAGNATSASVTRTPLLTADGAAARTGSWRTLRNAVFLDGRALTSGTAGSSMTYTFTGRGVALLASRTTGSGRVRVYLDGADRGLVDLRSTTAANRLSVWAGNYSASAPHTLKVQVEGTAGRPGVIMDGIVVLR
jgi:hypothetical protein